MLVYHYGNDNIKVMETPAKRLPTKQKFKTHEIIMVRSIGLSSSFSHKCNMVVKKRGGTPNEKIWPATKGG